MIHLGSWLRDAAILPPSLIPSGLHLAIKVILCSLESIKTTIHIAVTNPRMKHFTNIIAFNIHNSVHSLNRYLFGTYFVPGSMLGTWDKVDNEADFALLPKERMVYKFHCIQCDVRKRNSEKAK